jgi:signal transduction histidine kinase
MVISVVDTGNGMSPEVRDSLFTYRAISSKAGGTGLGTKIVKDVVDAHGGTISVESEEGKGTTFHITLLVDGPPAASP